MAKNSKKMTQNSNKQPKVAKNGNFRGKGIWKTIQNAS